MVKNATDKAGRIPRKIRERDRKSLKHWKPYRGPGDWSFIVLNPPPMLADGEKNERPVAKNG